MSTFLLPSGTSAPSERRLSRVYARQLLEEAEGSIEDLLALAELPDDG